MTITGYKYNTEIEAEEAMQLCSDYYGVPNIPENVTKHWIGYSIAQLNDPIFWYIEYDESVLNILGNPIEFDVVQYDF
jgi:hypothetical protein